MSWIVALVIFACWMMSAYRTGKVIIELKNQIISLSHYAGLTKEQIQELKKKHGIK